MIISAIILYLFTNLICRAKLTVMWLENSCVGYFKKINKSKICILHLIIEDLHSLSELLFSCIHKKKNSKFKMHGLYLLGFEFSINFKLVLKYIITVTIGDIYIYIIDSENRTPYSKAL